MVAEIKAWLNGDRDFATGADLYHRYGKDALFKSRLQSGETSLLKSELFHAVKALLSPRPLPAPIVVAPVSEPSGNAISDAAKQSADLLYKQMQNKRAELLALCPLDADPLENDATAQNNRGLLANEILTLQGRVDKAYNDYRYALAHGKLPDIPEPLPVDPVLLYQQITNLRKNISKLKKNPAKAGVLAEKQQLLSSLINQYEDARKS